MAKTRRDLYNESRYRCCCRLCHSSSGSTLIGGLQMFALVGFLLHLAMSSGPPTEYHNTSSQIAGVIIAILTITLIVLLHVYGVYFRRPLCIIPFMVLQILCLLALLVGTMILAVRLGGQTPDPVTRAPDSIALSAASNDSTTASRSNSSTTAGQPRSVDFYWKIGFLAAFIAGAFLHLWFFVVALTAYRYVRAVVATPKNPLAQYRVEPVDIG